MQQADRFNRRCEILALVAVVGLSAIGLALKYYTYDFSQYYMGAIVAREGAWEVLYPIPRPDSVHNPGPAEDSHLRPGYITIRDRYGAPDATRFIHPPPMALFLMPLAWLRPTSAHVAWLAINALCAWGVAVLAGRSYRLMDPHPSRIPGLLALGAACAPVTLFAVRISNLLPVTALMIGLAVTELLRRDGPRGALALFGAILTKYAGFILLPLHVLMGRWRTMLWLAAIMAGTVTVSLLAMGTGPFAVFSSEIAPRLRRSFSQAGNHSLTGMLLRIIGTEVLPLGAVLAVRIAQGAVLCVVLLLIHRRRAELRRADRLFPAAAMLLLWMLIFAPVCWYQVYLLPFWGWVVWEMRRGSGFAKALGAAAIGLGCMSASMRPLVRLPEPLASYGLLAMLAMLALAAWSLYRPARLAQPAAVAGGRWQSTPWT